MLSASNVHAYENRSWFMGADAEYFWFRDYSVLAATLLGGYRWNKAALEVGYTKPFSNNLRSNNELAQIINSGNIYLDATGYYNINQKVELLAKLGVGYFMVKKAQEDTYYWRQQSIGARFGVGVQYALNCAARTAFLYTLQTTNSNFPTAINMISIRMVYSVPY